MQLSSCCGRALCSRNCVVLGPLDLRESQLKGEHANEIKRVENAHEPKCATGQDLLCSQLWGGPSSDSTAATFGTWFHGTPMALLQGEDASIFTATQMWHQHASTTANKASRTDSIYGQALSKLASEVAARHAFGRGGAILGGPVCPRT